jgi:hypothetical protein
MTQRAAPKTVSPTLCGTSNAYSKIWTNAWTNLEEVARRTSTCRIKLFPYPEACHLCSRLPMRSRRAGPQPARLHKRAARVPQPHLVTPSSPLDKCRRGGHLPGVAPGAKAVCQSAAGSVGVALVDAPPLSRKKLYQWTGMERLGVSERDQGRRLE